MHKAFDVIVVGGGHAGTEAALVAARMGAVTALLTFSEDTVGQMSCNPAIGGLGKGQLVKEIDALFGEMALAIDDTGVQFRTLNSSKGPAVQSSRAQADRELYRRRILSAVNRCPNLTLISAEATELVVSRREAAAVTGVRLADGTVLSAPAVVLTTGTFLRGLMHTGEQQSVGGRTGERASITLSDSILSLGLRMGRLKTGTPPRLRRSTIDFSKLVEQPGDTPIRPFSFRTAKIDRPQLSCWITSTNSRTHEIIGENVERSPMFNGQIQSVGPRYCPSIEDKVFRFRDRNSHNIFLEPEGFQSDIVYPNGISTSLPADVQERFVRSIAGLEQVEIIRPGYAVEYDYIDPTELDRTLAVRNLSGLFCAGQINGTSGYEEAGAQGILAGINAALFVRRTVGQLGAVGQLDAAAAADRLPTLHQRRPAEPFVLGRDESYIGVMIDDLTTQGVMEPYRMFTSRAEYRLHLREDNADERLTPKALELGLVSDEEWRKFSLKQEKIAREKRRLETTVARPTEEINAWLREKDSAPLSDGATLATLLRRPELSYTAIEACFPAPSGPDSEPLTPRELTRVETELKFEGYLKRQQQDIDRLKRMEQVVIPSGFAFDQISSLSVEVRHRLNEVRPTTLGQAGRITGVTPAAISLLAIYLRKEAGSAA